MNDTQGVNAGAVPSSVLLCLVVGGPHDGQRIRTRGEGVIRLFTQCAHAMQDDLYRRERFVAGKLEIEIYRHDSLTIEQATQMLFDGYRHNNDSAAPVL